MPSESCSPSSLSCNLWCMAFEFLVSGEMSLQTSLFKRATGDDNLLVWGQECCVDMATLAIQNLWWPSVAMEELLLRHLSFGTNSMKTSIQTPWCFSLVVRICCYLSRKKFARITPLLSKKAAAMIFSATHTLQFWPCTIDLIPSDFHLFGSVKKTKGSLWVHHNTNDKVLQNGVHQWLWRMESCSCRKVEEDCWQSWRLQWKITVS